VFDGILGLDRFRHLHVNCKLFGFTFSFFADNYADNGTSDLHDTGRLWHVVRYLAWQLHWRGEASFCNALLQDIYVMGAGSGLVLEFLPVCV
jgi:hypothetical protein